jgi:hypothetical protein
MSDKAISALRGGESASVFGDEQILNLPARQSIAASHLRKVVSIERNSPEQPTVVIRQPNGVVSEAQGIATCTHPLSQYFIRLSINHRER